MGTHAADHGIRRFRADCARGASPCLPGIGMSVCASDSCRSKPRRRVRQFALKIRYGGDRSGALTNPMRENASSRSAQVVRADTREQSGGLSGCNRSLRLTRSRVRGAFVISGSVPRMRSLDRCRATSPRAGPLLRSSFRLNTGGSVVDLSTVAAVETRRSASRNPCPRSRCLGVTSAFWFSANQHAIHREQPARSRRSGRVRGRGGPRPAPGPRLGRA